MSFEDVSTQGNFDVDVIIPTFNSSMVVERAVDSVLCQTLPAKRIILIDDRSSDKTLQLLVDKYGACKQVTIISTIHNSGAATARNLGLLCATSPLVAFLDSDDKWAATKLERQVDFMREWQCDAVFCAMRLFNGKNDMGRRRRFTKQFVSFSELLAENVISTSTVLMKWAPETMPLMPNLRRRQDYAYWLILLSRDWSFFYQDELLVDYDVSTKGLSSNKLKLIIANYLAFRAVPGITPIRAIAYTLTNIYRRVVPGASKARY